MLVAGGLAAAAAAASVLTSAQSATAQVSAYPLPGTISASPTTQISLRGVAPDALGTISRQRIAQRPPLRAAAARTPTASGPAGCRIAASRRGETVTVRTGLHVRGARDGDFRFRIARIPGRVTIPKVVLEDIDAGKTRRFRSRPDLAPPVVTVDPGPRQTSPRLRLPQPEVQEGPEAGRADDRRQRRPADLLPPAARDPGGHGLPHPDLQGPAGPDVLAGHLAPGHRDRRAGDARPVLPRHQADPHAQRLPAGPARVPADTARPGGVHHLSGRAHRPAPVGGSRDGLAVDSVIQEVDLDTGLVTFEWHSLGKIALRETHSRPAASARDPVRLRPRELGRGRRQRRLPAVGPQHLGGLQDRPRDRRHRLAPRRPPQRLRARPRRPLRLAARRPLEPRRHADACSTTPPSRPSASTRAP